MATTTLPTRDELLRRYRQEPIPGPPSEGTYFPDVVRRQALRQKERVAVAADFLTPDKWRANAEDREWHTELIEARLFTREELDELIEVGRIHFERWVADQRRKELRRALAEEIRRVEKEFAAAEEAARRRRLEAEARKRLGWPKEGLPE